MGTTLLNLFF